ncbi:MAG: hypothetical protein MJ188_10200 [Treponema sp.]|nr:hypothetical protein [Treponema sp.]
MERIFNPYIFQDQKDGEEGQQYIANVRDGAKFGFRYFEMSDPELSVVTKGSDGKLLVYIDSEPAGEIELQNCSKWAKSNALGIHVNGVHELSFVYEGDGIISVNEICFEGKN